MASCRRIMPPAPFSWTCLRSAALSILPVLVSGYPFSPRFFNRKGPKYAKQDTLRLESFFFCRAIGKRKGCLFQNRYPVLKNTTSRVLTLAVFAS